jgi:hypothetical protein
MIERRNETIAVRLEKTLYDLLDTTRPAGRSISSFVRELIVMHLLNNDYLTEEHIKRLAGVPVYVRAIDDPTYVSFPICETCGTNEDVFECPICDTPVCSSCLHQGPDHVGAGAGCLHEDRTTLARTVNTGW